MYISTIKITPTLINLSILLPLRMLSIGRRYNKERKSLMKSGSRALLQEKLEFALCLVVRALDLALIILKACSIYNLSQISLCSNTLQENY